MWSYSDFVYSLKELIDELEKDLQRYAFRTDANDRYIERQNRLIGQLVNIYNGINLPNPEVWIALNEKMDQLRKADPYLKGFVIELAEKPTGHMASIRLNLFAI